MCLANSTCDQVNPVSVFGSPAVVVTSDGKRSSSANVWIDDKHVVDMVQTLAAVEKSLRESALRLNPQVKGQDLLVPIPR